jgi:uncharacterized membrane protein
MNIAPNPRTAAVRSFLTTPALPEPSMAYFTTFGAIHTAAASVGIITGATQVIRTQRGTFHRRLGYTYIGAMVVADISVMAVKEFTGSFNFFHALAAFNLITMALALRPMLMKPRPYQWKLNHYMWICWSYAGLLAAGMTEFLLRVPKVHWAILIMRLKPAPRVIR